MFMERENNDEIEIDSQPIIYLERQVVLLLAVEYAQMVELAVHLHNVADYGGDYGVLYRRFASQRRIQMVLPVEIFFVN